MSLCRQAAGNVHPRWRLPADTYHVRATLMREAKVRETSVACERQRRDNCCECTLRQIRATAYPPKWAHVIGAFLGRSLTTLAPPGKPHLHSSPPNHAIRAVGTASARWPRKAISAPPAFLFTIPTILLTPFTYTRSARKACR